MSGGGFGGGTGTEADPYIVEDAADLNAVRNDLTAYYKQNANIDLNVDPYNTGSGWSPIGDAYDNYFSGGYDGDSYTITNIYISRSTNGLGLFGFSGATLSNITMTNCLIECSAASYVGALVGVLQTNSDLTNCSIKGVVQGDGYVGGLIGYVPSGGNIDQCSAEISMTTSSNYVGGLIGSYSATTDNDIISQCWTSGIINSSASYVGGMIGQVKDGKITDMHTCYSSCDVSGTDYVGGLIGDTDSGATSSYWTELDLSKSFARGDVDGGDYIGGLMGNVGNYSVVTQCYSTGAVTATGTNVGGLIGENNNSVSSSVYDKDTSGQTDDTGKGTPKTTAEMKDEQTYIDLGWGI